MNGEPIKAVLRRAWASLKALPRTARRPAPRRVLASLGIAALVWASVGVVRWTGALQRLELIAYDQLLRHTLRPTKASPVVIVGMTSADQRSQELGWPVADDKLAMILQRILNDGPRALGLDLYRPGVLGPELTTVLEQNPKIVAITELGDTRDLLGDIPPPDVLRGKKDRVAVNEFVLDPDGVVRRALLKDTGRQDEQFWALGALMAKLYLNGETPPIKFQPPSGPHTFELGRWKFSNMRRDWGPYATAEAGALQWPFDYRGHPGVSSVSFGAVYSGQVSPGQFKDKIVLVGGLAMQQKDVLYTPRGRYEPGVLLHAGLADQMVRAALTGDAGIVEWRAVPRPLWVLLWSLLGFVLGYVMRPSMVWVGLWVLGFALILAAAWVGFRNGVFVSVVPPALAWLGSSIMVMLCTFAGERRDTAAFRQLMGRLFPPKVVDLLWRRHPEFFYRGRLDPEPMYATVLFTDLQGFTTIAEPMRPERLMKWLNIYFSAVSDVVEEEGGMINKFNGDQIVALFGPPVPRSPEQAAQDARCAVDCALKMREKFAQLIAKWKLDNLPQTRMRIGIQSGEVVAGSLGSARRIEYTVVGDTVNIASRLEGFRKELMDEQIAPGGCRVIIGDETARLVGSRYVLQELGEDTLAGRNQKIAIFAVLGYRNRTDSFILEQRSGTPTGSSSS